MSAQKLANPKVSGVPCLAPWVKPRRINKTPRFSAAEITGDLFPIMHSGLKEYKITRRKCLHAAYKIAKPRSPLQEFTISISISISKSTILSTTKWKEKKKNKSHWSWRDLQKEAKSNYCGVSTNDHKGKRMSEYFPSWLLIINN